MDIDHAKMLRTELENNLTKLINEFEIQTGLTVTDIREDEFRQFGSRPEYKVRTILR